MATLRLSREQRQMLAANRVRASVARERRALQAAIVRKAAIGGTAAIYGALDRFAIQRTVAGFPWKIAVWTGASIVEAVSGGLVQALAGGVSDATLAVYLHRAIAENTLVAGGTYPMTDREHAMHGAANGAEL